VRRAGRRDGPDERDGVRVDGEIVVEGVIEEREEVRDLRVHFEKTPEGKLHLAYSLHEDQLQSTAG